MPSPNTAPTPPPITTACPPRIRPSIMPPHVVAKSTPMAMPVRTPEHTMIRMVRPGPLGALGSPGPEPAPEVGGIVGNRHNRRPLEGAEAEEHRRIRLHEVDQ